MVSNGQSSGGCIYFPDAGGTVCSDQSTTVQEREYYKRGIGPIGYYQYIGVTDNGGGFYTANTIKRNLELVGTSLTASDGTTFNPPASREGRPMPAARAYHGCAALGGKLYVVGGSGAAGTASMVFVYDPATDAWSSTPEIVASGRPGVVAAQGLLVAFPVNGGVATFDPATNAWTQRQRFLGPVERSLLRVVPRPHRRLGGRRRVQARRWARGLRVRPRQGPVGDRCSSHGTAGPALVLRGFPGHERPRHRRVHAGARQQRSGRTPFSRT